MLGVGRRLALFFLSWPRAKTALRQQVRKVMMGNMVVFMMMLMILLLMLMMAMIIRAVEIVMEGRPR